MRRSWGVVLVRFGRKSIWLMVGSDDGDTKEGHVGETLEFMQNNVV